MSSCVDYVKISIRAALLCSVSISMRNFVDGKNGTNLSDSSIVVFIIFFHMVEAVSIEAT